jgi:hypothetical protein
MRNDKCVCGQSQDSRGKSLEQGPQKMVPASCEGPCMGPADTICRISMGQLWATLGPAHRSMSWSWANIGPAYLFVDRPQKDLGPFDRSIGLRTGLIPISDHLADLWTGLKTIWFEDRPHTDLGPFGRYVDRPQKRSRAARTTYRFLGPASYRSRTIGPIC